jgi:hypothetical protein
VRWWCVLHRGAGSRRCLAIAVAQPAREIGGGGRERYRNECEDERGGHVRLALRSSASGRAEQRATSPQTCTYRCEMRSDRWLNEEMVMAGGKFSTMTAFPNWAPLSRASQTHRCPFEQATHQPTHPPRQRQCLRIRKRCNAAVPRRDESSRRGKATMQVRQDRARY